MIKFTGILVVLAVPTVGILITFFFFQFVGVVELMRGFPEIFLVLVLVIEYATLFKVSGDALLRSKKMQRRFCRPLPGLERILN